MEAELMQISAGETGWDISHLILSKKQIKIAAELHAWLSQHSLEIGKAIAKQRNDDFASDQMRLLEQSIIVHFRPLANAAEVLKVFCKVVDGINLGAGVQLPVPLVPNLSARPKNPFRMGIPVALQRARIWRNAMPINLVVLQDEEGEGLDRQVMSNQSHVLGKLLSSAILHGGMTDASLLIALVRALAKSPSSLAFFHGYVAIELSVAWHQEAEAEHRYWYPDTLTAELIARLPEGVVNKILTGVGAESVTDQQVRKKIWGHLSAYFRSLSIKKADRPSSLSDLLGSVLIDLQTRLPMVLVNYAGRKLVSHSPSKQVNSRLLGLPVPKSQPKEESEFTPPAEYITDFNQTSDNFDDLEPHWLSGLRKTLSKGSASEVSMTLDVIIQCAEPASIESCFAEFAQHLVSSLSASGNRLALSTAKAYLVAVSKRLGGRLGEVDPRTLESETLEALYGEILEDIEQDVNAKKQRRRVAQGLQEFHHFLVRKFQFEPINPREVLGIGKGLIPVDANLITPDEYDKIYQFIPQAIIYLHPSLPGQANLVKAAQLIFMLAFKCGLRRMEVLKLKSIDLCEHEPAELLIRPSDGRRLKTKSSTRKIPLYALLSKQDILDLRNWKKKRQTEINPSKSDLDQFLFGIPELDYEFIPQDTLFPILHHAMRAVTKDSVLRFHHLRHGFASWTFLRLILADFPDAPELFQHLPATSEFLKDSCAFRDMLYGRSDPTRRHLYAVASLLGHSGPEISLEHYIHFCDIGFALWRDRDVIAPTRKLAVTESGRPQSTSYRWGARGLPHIPYRLLKRRWPDVIGVPQIKFAAEVLPLLSDKKTLASIFDDSAIFSKAWQMLYQYGVHGTSLEELADTLGFDEQFATLMFQAACEIRDIKVSRGNKGYRHRMVEFNLDRRQRGTTSRIACPIAPHTVSDIAIANSLIPIMLVAMRSHPELCQSVFNYYLHNAWQTRNEIVFKDPACPYDALQFIEFLSLLGIKKRQMRFVSYDAGQRSASLAAWKEKLGLSSRYQIDKTAPPRKSNVAAKKWLGIKPVFTSVNHQNKHSDTEQTGSIAFRYLMVMGAIISSAISIKIA